jgi:hypothetical protein
MKAFDGWTRFLGVSGAQSSFPKIDWRGMSGGARRPFRSRTKAITFISRVNAWDAFIIYAVDLERTTLEHEADATPGPSFYPGYPPPPSNVIPLNSRQPQVIFYNQPVRRSALSL